MSFLVRLRPTGPWRIGPLDGARDQVDLLYRSDALFSAVSSAMRELGCQKEWLAATAANPNGSVVRFSSLFPFVAQADLVTPPRTLWPPPPSARVRWKGARFVPLGVVEAVLAGSTLDEDAWFLDGPSECLLPAGAAGPFRASLRTNAAIDRLTGIAAPHATACLEFQPGAGLWGAVTAAEEWEQPVRTAFRLLADSGFGGERSQGWGRSEEPEFSETPTWLSGTGETNEYWMLALYSPAGGDEIDWDRGSYTVVTRGGWVESPARHGNAKKLVQMIEEGSVLSTGKAPDGAAPDVAPDGFPHPVYRAGFAFSVPLAQALVKAPPALPDAASGIEEIVPSSEEEVVELTALPEPGE